MIEQQMREIITGLKAEPGDDQYFRGLLSGTPFLFKALSPEPIAYLFKLRMRQALDQPSKWHEHLEAEYSAAKIRSEIEGDYAWLWIDDAASIDGGQIVALVSKFAADHGEHLLQAGDGCVGCGEPGKASLYQFGSGITFICPSCLEARKTKQAAAEIHLNPVTPVVSILLPLAVAACSAGWALFWLLYDEVFSFLGTHHLHVPTLALLLVVAGVGFGLGYPIGLILRRSGISRRLSAVALATGFTLISLSLGEIGYASILVFRALGAFDVPTILHNTLPLAFGNDGGYAFMKVLFAGGLGFAIHEIAKPKTVRLEI